MTLDELNALPELGGIGYREEIRRRAVRIPYAMPDGVLFQKEDDPVCVRDDKGQGWMIGWMNGVRYKRRLLT